MVWVCTYLISVYEYEWIWGHRREFLFFFFYQNQLFLFTEICSQLNGSCIKVWWMLYDTWLIKCLEFLKKMKSSSVKKWILSISHKCRSRASSTTSRWDIKNKIPNREKLALKKFKSNAFLLLPILFPKNVIHETWLISCLSLNLAQRKAHIF